MKQAVGKVLIQMIGTVLSKRFIKALQLAVAAMLVAPTIGLAGTTYTLAEDTFNNGSADGYSIDRGDDNRLLLNQGDRSEKTYDFGSRMANVPVTVDFDMAWFDGWDNSGTYQDFFKVDFNGQNVVNDTFFGNGTRHYTLNTTLDENGRLTIAFIADTTYPNVEYAAVDNVTITAENQPPRFDSDPPTLVRVGTEYTYNVTVTDPEGDPVTVTATQLPSWLSFDANTLTLSGSTDTPGYYDVTLKATDDQGNESEQSFTINAYDVLDNAYDLCYDEVSYSGLICLDFGFFKGGIGCTQTISLRNISPDQLTDVRTVIDISGFSGDVFSECGIDEQEGSCQEDNMFDFGPVGIMERGIVYDPMPDFGPDDNHTIYNDSLIEAAIFSGENLFGSYFRGNYLYYGQIYSCDELTGQYRDINDPVCGAFPTVLSSFKGITTQKNDIFNTCTISVKDANLVEETTINNALTCQDCNCETDSCSQNGSCTIIPEPDSRIDYLVYSTTITANYTVDRDWNNDDGGMATVTGTHPDMHVTFHLREYGSYTLSDDVSDIYFNPDATYSDSDTKLMVLGDIRFDGNDQTVTFEGGDYYFRSFKIDKDTNGNINQLSICAKDDIRLFISGDFVYSGNHINDSACGGKIFIYVEGNAEIDANGGGSSDMPIFLYTKGDVTIESSGNSNGWYGAITAEGYINIPGENINFTYDGDPLSGYGECCLTVQFAKDHYDISENINEIGTTRTVYPVITLNRAADYDVNVTYYTIDGTATAADGDYVPVSGTTVTIPAGETNVTIPIKIYNDAPIELDEYFFVKLKDPAPEGQVCMGDLNQTQINILEQNDAPICFEDDFSNGLDSKWRVLKADGGYTPQVVEVNGDYRLRLTPADYHIATAITKDYEFSTSQNLIIVEFDYYAYGGHYISWAPNGADGIASVLFDSFIGGDSPEPGAMGGSLGYAQKDSDSDGAHPGFQGGWLGLGMDEFGNYSNPTEGRNGGPGFTPNAVAIRGDGNYSYGTPDTYEEQGYEYLAGVQLDDAEHPLAKRSASDYYSGRYKFTVDARDPNHLYITLERSLTGDPADYQVIIDKFDAKDPQYNQGETPKFVRYAITASTGAADNIHEISWIRLRGNCAVYGHTAYLTGPFDAWDIFRGDSDGDGTIDDRNISTKISGNPFYVMVGSFAADGQYLELKPYVDAKYALYYFDANDNELPYDGVFYDFNASNDLTTVQSFTVNGAFPRMYVRIQYCADMDDEGKLALRPYDDCPAGDAIWEGIREQGLKLRYHRSDLFAVRPDAFSGNVGTNYIAEQNNTMTFQALDINGNPTANYNENEGGTFVIDINLSDPTRDCTYTYADLIPSVGFTNGTVTNNYRFNRIGDFNLTLRERTNCGLRFAYVDCDDRNVSGSWNTETDLPITPYVKNNIHVAPSAFTVTNIAYGNYLGHSYTYLSNLDINKTMASLVTFDLTAVKADNAKADNYTGGCYANDFNVTLTFTPTSVAGLNNLQMYDSNTSTPVTTGPTRSFSKSYFLKANRGTVRLNLFINFDRNSSVPVNPFDHNLTQVAAVDTLGLNGSAAAPAGSAARFYYGRLHAPDYNTDQTSISTPIYVEVYSNQNSATRTYYGMGTWQESVDDVDWWQNPIHAATDGSILRLDANLSSTYDPDITINGTVSTDPTVHNLSSGQYAPTIGYTNTVFPHKTTINVETAPWLKYHRYFPDGRIYYDVVFERGANSWAGIGELGQTVDGNSSTNTSRRIDW